MVYSYYLDECDHTLTIYEGYATLCTISGVYTEAEAEELTAEVIYEWRGVEWTPTEGNE